MLRLERKDVSEIDYPKLYKEIFGEADINHPRHVYMVYDEDKYVGFMSGFPMDSNTWYMQVVGFIPNEQKKVSNIYRSAIAVNTLHQDWYGILVRINTLNVEALRVALSIGFVIVGTRMDTGRNLWVELMHLRSEEDAVK